MGDSSSCNVCRMVGFNLSGPAALCGFKHRSSLSVPSAEMLNVRHFGVETRLEGEVMQILTYGQGT